MSYNRIAIYGHRGWASSEISKAVINSGAPVTVLYRPGSDVSMLPSHARTIEVAVSDTKALIASLKDIDIVLSLVGQQAIADQYEFIKAIPSTNVKLFVPSDLGYKIDEKRAQWPTLSEKVKVEQAARDAGIPTTTIRPGNFVGSTISTILLGVDVKGNRIIYTGDSENQKLSMCSRAYVAEAYAQIFAKTPVTQLQNRAIATSELIVTGKEIASALERRHGVAPAVFRQSLQTVEEEIAQRLERKDMTALVFCYRAPWGEGKQLELIGDDHWDVKGYQKKTLTELIEKGEAEPYKDFPPPFYAALDATFFSR